MKIVAMVGGLGSQIMKYMFFLLLQEQIGEEEILIDTSSFDYLECWNGYELEKLFGICHKDIWNEMPKKRILEYENYRDVVLHYCYSQIDKNSCFYYKGKKYNWTKINDIIYDSRLLTRGIFRFLKKVKWYLKHMWRSNAKNDEYPINYSGQHGITYYDDFCHVSDKYLFKDKAILRNIFMFPAFDEKNQIVADMMCSGDSVALHVRRSDHLYDNKDLFSREYFKKAVQHMKASLEQPVFFIFSEDMEWCREHLEELGIGVADKYMLVDWNEGSNSYRDMQLMTYCKNNILVMSSFSWCGYYLSIHKKKIVIAPEGWWLEVPLHM